MAATVTNVPVLNVWTKMSSVALTNNVLNPNGYWDKPVAKLVFIPTASDLDLFDQNGYDLTELEKHFASSNIAGADSHRCHRTALKQPWFTQGVTVEGAHLNHSLLFERKGYSGAALEQLKHWANKLPLVNKVIALRPKWGLDFSMDYVDRQGNTFEILHWEYDGFDYDEIDTVRRIIEPVLQDIDWQDAGQQILAHKEQWHHLDFFAQSNWKCDYFGIPREQFKMVAWK
jgi:hypothetical protein